MYPSYMHCPARFRLATVWRGWRHPHPPRSAAKAQVYIYIYPFRLTVLSDFVCYF